MKLIVFIATIAVAALSTQPTAAFNVTVTNGRSFGDWAYNHYCPSNNKAVGFFIKVESPQGSDADDTALNGITLICGGGFNITVYSGFSQWGNYTAAQFCPNNGVLVGFQLRVEKLFAGIGDDTAVNDINFKCSGGETLLGNSPTPWGTWGSWSETCTRGFNGLITRIETPQGSGDDTALNNVIFFC